MNENNGSEFSAFLAGFVIGGLVGAAAALILAPMSGEETRSKITAKGEELRERADQYRGEYREMAESYIADARDRAQNVSAQVQEQASIVLDEGKAKINTAKDKVNEVAQRVTPNQNNDEDATTA